jgi:hypothetical protein
MVCPTLSRRALVFEQAGDRLEALVAGELQD